MEQPSNLLEQTAFDIRPKIEEHMLIVMDKSTQGEHLAQPLQTNVKQFKLAVTFLTGCNGIFKKRDSKIMFCFRKSVTYEGGFVQITIQQGSYEIEGLNKEIEIIVADEGQFTEANYPFTIESKFSTPGSIIQISPQGPITSFMFDDSIRDLSRFNARTL